VPAFAEDRRTPLLRAVAHRDEAALPRLLSAGLLGAVPELLGVAPGRRIWVLAEEDALLLEDHGEVRLKRHPPGWCAQLLTLLASGDVPKQALVAGLWGLRQYRPERHDALIRTTIHRLRAFIEPFGAWVRVTPNGYGTTVPVVFVGGALPTEPPQVEPEEWGAAPLGEPRETASLPAPSTNPDEERAIRLLSARGPASVREVAKALGASQSTALRLLRALVEQGSVRRAGFARATRYALRPRDAEV
jgi:IclR helix-turn-helix domain